MKQIALIVALLMCGLFAANLDIVDDIAPSATNDVSAQGAVADSQNANPVANQGANPPANQANQTTNQPQNSANPAQNQANNANPSANQNANAVNPPANQVANQPTQPQQSAQQAQPTPAPKAPKTPKPRPSDPDERLKEDIVNFEREKYFQNNENIDDPFVYVYREATEDEIAMRNQLEQAVLILKSIIIAPDSNNNRIKRYKAHINNQWVEECKTAKKGKKCDVIEGWEVARITEDSVKLRVTRYNMKRDLQLVNKKVTIKKANY